MDGSGFCPFKARTAFEPADTILKRMRTGKISKADSMSVRICTNPSTVAMGTDVRCPLRACPKARDRNSPIPNSFFSPSRACLRRRAFSEKTMARIGASRMVSQLRVPLLAVVPLALVKAGSVFGAAGGSAASLRNTAKVCTASLNVPALKSSMGPCGPKRDMMRPIPNTVLTVCASRGGASAMATGPRTSRKALHGRKIRGGGARAPGMATGGMKAAW
mmetsp:Transcript_14003/g.23703  ORF Transcript_14003/g.23703 Transcript_14003/m.23703 type:complete len:219 (-) Transcript_14003:746-1402(-)